MWSLVERLEVLAVVGFRNGDEGKNEEEEGEEEEAKRH